MPCFFPLTAWKPLQSHRGSAPVFVKPRDGLAKELKLPCGRCVGCRLERSKQWSIRINHEASLFERNCFITLTFSPEHLPNPPILDVKIFQDFMKRLRKQYVPKCPYDEPDLRESWFADHGIRFYHCGEYGERTARPHYHAILFNFDPPDKVLWKVVNGHRYYISKSLEEIWGLGHVVIGEVTFESAAYVARYVMKKINGPNAQMHYSVYDKDTGEFFTSCLRSTRRCRVDRESVLGGLKNMVMASMLTTPLLFVLVSASLLAIMIVYLRQFVPWILNVLL